MGEEESRSLSVFTLKSNYNLFEVGQARSKHCGILKKNSTASVRKRTIPTERPPLVGEASAYFLRIEGATWSA
jgi:hypothetical protein